MSSSASRWKPLAGCWVGVGEPFPTVTAAQTPAWRFDLGNRLGECVLWDDRTQTAHWTDIEAATFWAWPFGTAAPTSMPLADRLASFGLTGTPGQFVGAFAKEFALFDPAAGRHMPIVEIEPGNSATMMNDGRSDRSGRFWASSKVVRPDQTVPSAKLWRLGRSAKARPFLDGLKVPNSLAWSRDGRTMYLSDSEAATIWRFAFDPEEGPTSPSVFARVDEGKPDGACVDAEGCLWVAHWGAAKIARYRPNGSIDRYLHVAARHPTCVAFGGPAFMHLLVTSETPDAGDKDASADGSMSAYETPHRGVPESRSDWRL